MFFGFIVGLMVGGSVVAYFMYRDKIKAIEAAVKNAVKGE